ncbi:MAG: hypothetical protein HEQ35_28040 [Gloeotrichia echinulata IR180]
MTEPQLSEKVRELIQKARIVSFATWQNTHPTEAIQLFQAADDEGRYLTDEDLQQIGQLPQIQHSFPSVTNYAIA